MVLLCTSSAIADKRTALVIGNGDYKSITALRNPVNDATDMKATLEKLGFDVILRTNADRGQIKEAVRLFESKIRNGGVGLFYYAGHGVQIDGTNYLIPVGVDVKRKYDVEEEALKMRYVLGAMEEANNNLNIIILDACRNNPFRGFRGDSPGLARMDAPKGSIIAYATAPGKLAEDGSGRNGTYTKYLLKNLNTSGVSVKAILNQTGLDVMKATAEEQIPWVSTTPIQDYYLTKGTYQNKVLPPSPDVKLPPSTSGLGDYGAVLKKRKEARNKWNDWQGLMDADYRKAEGFDKDSLLTAEEKTSLWGKFLSSYGSDNPHSSRDESLRQKARSRQNYWQNQKSVHVAGVSPRPTHSSPAPSSANIIDRDGVYVAYANGIVRDTSTGLEWKVGPDTGISWHKAQSWVQSLGRGWRMPTTDELKTLYKKGKGNRNMTPLLKMTGWYVWSAETRGSSSAWSFYFDIGHRNWNYNRGHYYDRAFAVRSRGDG